MRLILSIMASSSPPSFYHSHGGCPQLSDSWPGSSATRAALEEISSTSPSLGNELGINTPLVIVELSTSSYSEEARRGVIEEEDEKLLQVMLTVVFPPVERAEIEKIIKEKAMRVAEVGG